MQKFAGALFDESARIRYECEGMLEATPGEPPAWDGRIALAAEYSEKIRAGRWYRLNVNGGPSIMILVARIRPGPTASWRIAEFESVGPPLHPSPAS